MIPMREPTLLSMSLAACASFFLMAHTEPFAAVSRFCGQTATVCNELITLRFIGNIMVPAILLIASMNWILARSTYDNEWGPPQRKLLKCFMGVMIYCLEMAAFTMSGFYAVLSYLFYMRSSQPLGMSYAIHMGVHPKFLYENQSNVLDQNIADVEGKNIDFAWFDNFQIGLNYGFAWCWVTIITLQILIHLLGLLMTSVFAL